MQAGAAGGAATVVHKLMVPPNPTLFLTVLCRGAIGKTSKGVARGSDIGEAEGRALPVEGVSGEKEVREAEDWVGGEVYCGRVALW